MYPQEAGTFPPSAVLGRSSNRMKFPMRKNAHPVQSRLHLLFPRLLTRCTMKCAKSKNNKYLMQYAEMAVDIRVACN